MQTLKRVSVGVSISWAIASRHVAVEIVVAAIPVLMIVVLIGTGATIFMKSDGPFRRLLRLCRLVLGR